MAKTKFLSKVLAVLMALSMLCSTGVFADYDVSTSYGDVTVTGTITMSGTSVNGEAAFWGADTVEEAKWFDVTDGMTLTLSGKADAQTGTITYVVAPVGVLDQVPLDVATMEAKSVAIGTADIADGKFKFEIVGDATKLVKDTTYELRLAYSKTEIADVTDASALVYQRYLKSYDWADATTKATRVINKEGIGDITIDIEANPIRGAVIAAKVTKEEDRNNATAAPTHIRTANLKTGDIINYSNSGFIPADFKWAGEDVAAVTTATSRQSMAVEVGEALQGGVMLGMATAEVYNYYGGAQQRDNAAYRFKATNSGTVYILGSGTPSRSGWTEVASGAGSVNSYFNYGSRNYLYVASEITADMLTAAGAADVTAYLAANKGHAVQTADAPGYYRGGDTAWTGIGATFYAANTAFITPEGYFQVPAANLDEDGNWTMKTTNKPYSMGAVTNYGYTAGRGWLTQARTFAHTYVREFEAGEWVEIPYDSAVGNSAKNVAILQFDVPVAPLASATVTTAKTQFEIDALPMMSETEVAFEGEEYVIEVPRGTNTASFTVTNVNGATSEAIEVKMDANEKAVEAVIGDAEYDITVKFDDEYPSIYAFGYGKQYGSANRITIQYGDMNTDATLKFTAAATNVSSGAPLSGVTFANGAEKPAADKNLVVIGTPAANSGMNHMTTSTFGWLSSVTNNGTTFKVSAPATVYAKSVAFGNVAWPAIEALGWEVVGTFNGYNLYAKHFEAGATVQIPTQPITQAELDAKNATLTNGTMYAYITAENKSLNTGSNGAEGDVILWNHTDGVITSSSPIASGSNKGRSNFYVRPGAADTAFYAVFDSPLALYEATYSVDGGEAEAIEFAEGATTATVEVPYNAETVSVAAVKTGTGTVTVSEDLDLTNAASGTITITLTTPAGVDTVYTVNFTKGAPKILWESKLALTGTAANPGGANGPLYANGIYKVAEQSGEIDLSATEVDLEVAYGTEAIVLNNEVTIDLLSNNGAASGVIEINGTDYTVNVSWAAFNAENMSADAPLLYDLKYFVDGKTNLAGGGTWYYAMPTRLTLTEATDLVYGTGDVINNNGTADDTSDDKVKYENGEWFTFRSHQGANLQSVANGAAYLGRLHLSGESFKGMVETGDIDNKYALDGATMLVAHYQDKVAKGATRYSFKSAVDGYVISASCAKNTALTAADGWTLLEGANIVTSNQTTTSDSKNFVFEDATQANSSKQIGVWSTAFNYIYIKKVSVGDEVVIAESAVTSDVAPVVIVATEDMINEREVAPTLLSSLSYTTALAVTAPKESIAANSRDGKSLHAGGFYQPTLVTEAATVEVAEDATTVNVTVPYGTEIVNLAGTDTYENPVTFEAINLINNNGAVTVTKTVGEIEYTINVAWAAYDASADAAGNMVYDVKYRIKDLANSNYYNIVPTKLVLTENRIAPQTVTGYTDATGAKVYANAGEWYKSSDVAAANSNLMTHQNGAQINRGRLSLVAFDGWVRTGFVTESGIPGAPTMKEATDAEVDAIAYAAMNGVTTLVAHYQDYANLATAAGANASMAEHLTFKVAQDSIVYVSTTSSNIGEGWTKFDGAGKLYLHNQTNSEIYVQGEGETYTKFANNFITQEYSAGSNAFYRYANADDTVSLTLNATNSNITPVIIVRPVDFSAVEAPALEAATYKVGNGEATAVEFDAEKTATVEVPWGTTDEISVAASITGVGNVAISDAITLSNDAPTGAITVTITPVVGDAEPEVYTINFAWAAAPVVESVSYTTARTLYKGAVVTDAVVADETQTIEVPWGTDSVTVSYKIEGADAVTLDAVKFVDDTATVEVELPEETITLTFEYGDAPAGQYVTGLTKNGNWTDRMFVSYGDVDNAYTAANSGYEISGSAFFADDDEYSYRLPYGIAKKGYTAVIADAAANTGHGQMSQSQSTFEYLNGSYPATNGAENAWMSFKVAKDGMAYVTVPREDGVWTEIEALGWTEAPFAMQLAGSVKVYQKAVKAGDTVYMPNSPFSDDEMTYLNEKLEENEKNYRWVKLTADDVVAIEAEVAAEGKTYYYLAEGWAKQYIDWNHAEAYYNGFAYSGTDTISLAYYKRPNPSVIFVVDEAHVAAEAKAPKYTGASTMAADEAIELTAEPALYAAKGEISYKIVSGDEYATLEVKDGKYILTGKEEAYFVKDAKVKIEITETFADGSAPVTKEVTIFITDVKLTKYGWLTVEAADGSGTVTGTVTNAEGNEETVIEDTTEGAKKFDAGTIVTLTAEAEEGYKFRYWMRLNSDGTYSIYNRNESFSLAVPLGITLKAVFASESKYTVTFLGYQDKRLNSFEVDAEAPNIIVPNGDTVFGYTFKYFESTYFPGDQFEPEEEISAAQIDSDVIFKAVYDQDETMADYTLTVVGGTVDGDDDVDGSITVAYNTRVTVRAAETNEEGKFFEKWVDDKGQILSYEKNYTFYMMAADRTVEAIYADEVSEDTMPIITLTSVPLENAENGDPIIALFAERRVPTDYTVVENGIVYGYADNNYGLTEESEEVTLENYNGMSTSKYQNNNGQYTVRLQMTETRRNRGTWYASTYLTYVDTDGSIKTIYSDKTLVWKPDTASEEEIPEETPEDIPAE